MGSSTFLLTVHISIYNHEKIYLSIAMPTCYGSHIGTKYV